jgi:hypothetical protein
MSQPDFIPGENCGFIYQVTQIHNSKLTLWLQNIFPDFCSVKSSEYLNSHTRDQGRPTSRWKSFVGIRRLTQVEHLNPEMNFVSDHGSTPSANVKTLGELCDFCILLKR